jgi:hypothetical protein
MGGSVHYAGNFGFAADWLMLLLTLIPQSGRTSGSFFPFISRLTHTEGTAPTSAGPPLSALHVMHALSLGWSHHRVSALNIGNVLLRSHLSHASH